MCDRSYCRVFLFCYIDAHYVTVAKLVVSPCKMSRKVHCQQIRMAMSFAGIYQCSLDRGGAGSQWLCWISVVVLVISGCAW